MVGVAIMFFVIFRQSVTVRRLRPEEASLIDVSFSWRGVATLQCVALTVDRNKAAVRMREYDFRISVSVVEERLE